jgi:Dolichyl-phosphate-mannose-protein mannosyltransferase
MEESVRSSGRPGGPSVRLTGFLPHEVGNRVANRRFSFGAPIGQHPERLAMRRASAAGRPRSRSGLRSVVPACLITAIALLAMAGQGDFTSPPRYDGAGYAVLARSLAEGTGYRSIDHPDRPGHVHFPPGYPALLALAWRISGPSARVAHAVSAVCTLGATLAAWCWFRRMYSRKVALLLGLSLAVNWAWARTGPGIQSEPLYELLGQVTILVALRTVAIGGIMRTILLGGFLAACLLTRQIAIGLLVAVLLNLGLRKRWSTALAVVAVTLALVSPWMIWLIVAAGQQKSQANLLLEGSSGLLARVVSQGTFYLQRIPDQISGPLVEVATVIRPGTGMAGVANLWALIASAVVIAGLMIAVSSPRRRLASLIPLLTLVLLLAWPYTEAGRFLIPLIPCLLVGAVEGLSRLLQRGDRSLRGNIPRRRLAFAAAMLILMASLPYSCYSIASGRARGRDAAAHRDFDNACEWLTDHGTRQGPILTRHPGEVFLATGRQALEVSTSERAGELDDQADAIERTIAHYGVAYLLLDADRYLKAVPSPLSRFVVERPARVHRVFPTRDSDSSGVAIYEVLPPL